MQVQFKCLLDPRQAESWATKCAADPELAREMYHSLSRDEKERLLWDWNFNGRRKQILNVKWAWSRWIICAGRGFGKTRTGSEAVRAAVELHGCRNIALVARTSADCIAVMIRSMGGILRACPPWNRPKFFPSQRRLVWKNGAQATYYTADTPDILKGPEHDFCWADELCTWRYLEEVYSNIQLGLRLPGLCRTIITTTPKRVPFFRTLIDMPDTLLTLGTSYENFSNLSANFKDNIRQFRGTSKEREEVLGQLLGDVDGAMWKQIEHIDSHRFHYYNEQGQKQALPMFRKVVCGVDPATTMGKDSDATGIVVAAIAQNGRTYVLGDYTKVRQSAEVWATEIVRVCIAHRVNEIYCETNAGGDLIAMTIKNAFRASGAATHLPRIVELRSTENKSTRAEPVQALYEIGMVSHVGRLPDLEDEMTSWVPYESKKSPNRIDALVFAVNALNPNQSGGLGGTSSTRRPPTTPGQMRGQKE